MNSRGVDTLVLENDENWVKFAKLLAKAASEGRVDGKYRCRLCGMKYNSEAEAGVCCPDVGHSIHS